jgi:hypothetical protein
MSILISILALAGLGLLALLWVAWTASVWKILGGLVAGRGATRAAAIAGLLIAVGVRAQEPPPNLGIHLAPESRFWIEGRSTVSAFTCQAAQVDRSIMVGPPSEIGEIAGLPDALKAAMLSIPVHGFRCGNRRMDRDMYRAMKADAFSAIEYRLWTYAIEALPEAGGTYLVHTVGELSIAGAERVVAMEVTIEPMPDGRHYRVRGSKPILMTDFGIEPPTALFGLVKAKDRIVVHFDLIATAPAAVGPLMLGRR